MKYIITIIWFVLGIIFLFNPEIKNINMFYVAVSFSLAYLFLGDDK